MVEKILDHIYVIDGFVREFFIIGEKSVLLIDTGFGKDDILGIIREYTNLPIEVILTHAHRDHTGGAPQFDTIYLHEKDRSMYDGNTLPMPETYDIEDYHFEIIHIPGHTNGSIALYDASKKLLIAGDSIQQGPIFMFGKEANLVLYEESLNKLLGLDIDTVLASHHECILPGKYIQYCLDDLHRYQRGELEGVEHHQPDCMLYKGKNVSFFL